MGAGYFIQEGSVIQCYIPRNSLQKKEEPDPLQDRSVGPYQRFKKTFRASLVAQWLRIRLPMQGTQVQALVREDPTCRGVTKLASHNY